MYSARKLIILHFNFWLSFQRLCCLFTGIQCVRANVTLGLVAVTSGLKLVVNCEPTVCHLPAAITASISRRPTATLHWIKTACTVCPRLARDIADSSLDRTHHKTKRRLSCLFCGHAFCKKRSRYIPRIRYDARWYIYMRSKSDRRPAYSSARHKKTKNKLKNFLKTD